MTAPALPTRPARFAALAAAGLALAPPSAGAVPPPAARPQLLSPRTFAAAVARLGTVTIDVHVPRQGSIPGTDLWIGFDRLAATGRLPAARSTRLAVYCRSGRMSRIAVRTLVRLGYRQIVELRGGTDAWVASGRALVQ